MILSTIYIQCMLWLPYVELKTTNFKKYNLFWGGRFKFFCKGLGCFYLITSILNLNHSFLRPPLSVPAGQGSSLSEMPPASYQSISIHGTLPRRKKGGAGPAHGNYTWDPRANHTQQSLCGKTSLASRHIHQAVTSPLVQDTTDDCQGYRYTHARLKSHWKWVHAGPQYR